MLNAENRVDFLRRKLSGQSPDEYQHQLERQNEGHNCEHCGSPQGHRHFCPLLNRQSSEAASFVAGHYSEADRIVARGLGVIL